MDQTSLKRELRMKMTQVRSAIPEAARADWSASVSRHLIEYCSPLVQERGRLTVLSFCPFGDEVDIWPFNEHMWKTGYGYSVALPKVNRTDKRLELYSVSGVNDLAPGTWGIMEPKVDAVQRASIGDIDLIIVPGLAFDLNGGRLGYGGGFYDRLFRRYEEEELPLPRRIAAGYTLQVLDRVPMDELDYSIDGIVTEKGAFEVFSKNS